MHDFWELLTLFFIRSLSFPQFLLEVCHFPNIMSFTFCFIHFRSKKFPDILAQKRKQEEGDKWAKEKVKYVNLLVRFRIPRTWLLLSGAYCNASLIGKAGSWHWLPSLTGTEMLYGTLCSKPTDLKIQITDHSFKFLRPLLANSLVYSRKIKDSGLFLLNNSNL